MKEKLCPLVGSECLGFECRFYQTEFTKEPACLFDAGMLHLNEIAHNLRSIADSTESHKNIQAEFVKSAYTKSATPELLRLAGVV